MTAWRIVLVFLLVGLGVCCSNCLGPREAQAAESAADAVLVLCPKHPEIAQPIEAAAARYRVSAAVLTAVALAESSCNPRRANRATGCYGLTGIKVDGSANPDHLKPDELMDAETNADLGARHLAKLLRLCGTLGGALTVYHGRKGAYHGRGRCDVDEHARGIVRTVEWARSVVKRLQARRS